MKNQSSTLNQAIQSQLSIMEHFLHDMYAHVGQAQEHMAAGERNAAMGALLNCTERFTHLRTFYDAILVMHRNAELIERNGR